MTRPILILGLTRRVGTNFLARLLTQHSDCAAPTALQEDFLVSGLPKLVEYTRSVSSYWNKDWGTHEKLPQLRRFLGNGLYQFMQADSQDASRRTVFKTPAVAGLEYAPAFLPQCDLVVLTRFGPDVIESGMKGFSWSFEEACSIWGRAAQYVAELLERQRAAGRQTFMIVHYEDLVRDTENTLRHIFGYVGLRADRFNYALIDDFPIYGSSFDRGGQEKLHWSPVPLSAGFKPTERSKAWPDEKLKRFDELTRSVSKKLGYELPA